VAGKADRFVVPVRLVVTVTRNEWEMQHDDGMRRELTLVRVRTALHRALDEVEQP
jgi:hypothetical protein